MQALTLDAARAYIHATATVLQVPMDAARAERVAAQLVRTAAVAQCLEGLSMRPDDEPAEIYCPAPFARLPGGST